jgi:hypothetical protein
MGGVQHRIKVIHGLPGLGACNLRITLRHLQIPVAQLGLSGSNEGDGPSGYGSLGLSKQKQEYPPD